MDILKSYCIQVAMVKTVIIILLASSELYFSIALFGNTVFQSSRLDELLGKAYGQ